MIIVKEKNKWDIETLCLSKYVPMCTISFRAYWVYSIQLMKIRYKFKHQNDYKLSTFAMIVNFLEVPRPERRMLTR